MSNNIDKLIDLAKRTKSHIIVLDADQNPAYVIMDFAGFEKLSQGTQPLTSLSEEQLLDKVNAEIAAWKEVNKDKEFEDWSQIAEKSGVNKPAENDKNWLNKAKKLDEEIKTAQDYFFEPVN